MLLYMPSLPSPLLPRDFTYGIFARPPRIHCFVFRDRVRLIHSEEGRGATGKTFGEWY